MSIRLQGGARVEHVHIGGRPENATARLEDGETHSLSAELTGPVLVVTLDGLRREYVAAIDEHRIWLTGAAGTMVLTEIREAAIRPDDAHDGDAELTSPMPGTVVAIGVESASEVSAGDVVVTVEAMKMEHALTAPVDGVAELFVDVGDLVKVGQLLARITAHQKDSAQKEEGAL
jgi:acetyl-CoA/propionyl-CoA carboxylase biotin carboxyl carrier protein